MTSQITYNSFFKIANFSNEQTNITKISEETESEDSGLDQEINQNSWKKVERIM